MQWGKGAVSYLFFHLRVAPCNISIFRFKNVLTTGNSIGEYRVILLLHFLTLITRKAVLKKRSSFLYK